MTTKADYLADLELLALSKIKDEYEAWDRILPGSYDIDSIVSIQGTMNVGEDYEQRISPKLPWRSLFFAALSRMDPASRKTFVKVVECGSTPSITGGAASEIKGYENRLLAKTIQPCKGKVTINLSVEGITNEALV